MASDETLILRLRLGNNTIVIGGASSPYRLLASGLSGTEAAEAVTETTEQAQPDGALLLSRRLSGRDLTLQFEIADYDNREYYRRALLSFFDPGADGVLTVIRRDADGRQVVRSCGCMLSGRLCVTQETLDSYVRVRVPLFCPDPYFYSDTVQTNAARSVTPLLTFPLTLKEDEEGGAVGGLIRFEDTVVIENTGDAPTGFLLSMRAVDSAGNAGMVNPIITREEDGAYIRILTALAEDDVLTVSTVPGAKYVLKNGENCLHFDRGSTFFPLLRGTNTLHISADIAPEPPDTVISFRCRYFGA